MMVISLYTSGYLERAFRCPCRELSSSTLTLLVRCKFEVLVAISCVSWLLVDAPILAILSFGIDQCVSFCLKLEM